MLFLLLTAIGAHAQHEFGKWGARRAENESGKLIDVSDDTLDRWIMAMPEAFRMNLPYSMPIARYGVWGLGEKDWLAANRKNYPQLRVLQEILEPEIKSPEARIAALFKWYGSGSGTWTNYPSYEIVAEELLLSEDADLVSKVIDCATTNAELEGAARLVASGNFPARKISRASRRKLLKYLRRDGNPSKLETLETGFRKKR